MRKSISLLAVTALLTLLATGCANTEAKLGRGMRNITELVRGSEVRRSMEQTALFDGPDMAYTTGFVRGFNKSLVRTGVGIYEVLTAPFPPYDPVFTDYMTVNPVYPDSYQPHLIADPTFGPDTALGFSGGDVAPMIPGSRFRIFDY
jgi:putative exosortase-associated protein (TIGR04073 family)